MTYEKTQIHIHAYETLHKRYEKVMRKPKLHRLLHKNSQSLRSHTFKKQKIGKDAQKMSDTHKLYAYLKAHSRTNSQVHYQVHYQVQSRVPSL